MGFPDRQGQSVPGGRGFGPFTVAGLGRHLYVPIRTEYEYAEVVSMTSKTFHAGSNMAILARRDSSGLRKAIW